MTTLTLPLRTLHTLDHALKNLDGKSTRFNPVKDFRDKLIRLGMDLRIVQRPFVLSVGINTDLARYIKYIITYNVANSISGIINTFIH